MSETKLDVASKIVGMVSALAVPIVIAVFGVAVQGTIAEQSLRKDYTEIALRVLMQAESKDQDDLRHWAVGVLDDNTPFPFSDKAREQLIGGVTYFPSQLMLEVPEEAMKPPTPWVIPKNNEFTSHDQIMPNYNLNRQNAMENELRLRFLQKVVTIFVEAQNEREARHKKYAEEQWRELNKPPAAE